MFEYEKKIIGYLFRYYRLKNKMHIQDLISYKSEIMEEYCANCKRQCKSRNGIFSHKTIERMERGYPARSECYYVDFADKFGYIYEMSISLKKRLSSLEKELLLLLRSKRKEEFLRYRKKLINFVNNVEGIIYFEEISNLYLAVSNFEIDGKYASNDFADLLEYLQDFIQGDTRKILIYYLYCHFSHYDLATKKYIIYQKKTGEIYPEYIKIKFYNAITEMPFVDFYQYMKNYNFDTFKGADYLFYNDALALSYINVNKHEEAIECLDNCINFGLENDLLDQYMIQFYKKKGRTLYFLGRYTEVIPYFKKVFMYDINIMVMNIILYADCCEKSDCVSEMHDLITIGNNQIIRSEMVKTVFMYYQMKYNNQFKTEELENYIINDLKPFLRANTLYEEIIRNDLLNYCKKTRNYQKLFTYLSDNETVYFDLKTEKILPMAKE